MAGQPAIALAGTIPIWTLGDRLRKAREVAGLSQTRMAEEIGIARNSVGRYESDEQRPPRPVLIAWAVRTGVAYDWLAHGIEPIPQTRGGDGAAGIEGLPLLTVIDNSGYGYWGRLPRRSHAESADSHPDQAERSTKADLLSYTKQLKQAIPSNPNRRSRLWLIS